MPLNIMRQKRFELSDGSYMLFNESIDNKHRSRTENYAHYAIGKPVNYFWQTNKEIPLELSNLLKMTVQVILLKEDVTVS
jgi:hypothetical protein